MNVYLLKRGNLNFKTNKFEFYEDELFSSMKKVMFHADKMIEVNNGYGVNTEVIDFGSKPYTEITYNCMSAPSGNEDARPMKIRYCIYKKEVI